VQCAGIGQISLIEIEVQLQINGVAKCQRGYKHPIKPVDIACQEMGDW